MNSWRGTSIATGALLILATVAAVAAAALDPTLTGPDYLTVVVDRPHQLAGAALLYLIAAGSSVGIAITLYPLLKQINVVPALGSVVFRTIEAVFYIAAVVSLTTILTLGGQSAAAPAGNRAATQAIADSFLSMGEHATLVAVFAFTLGALMYYTLFYRAELVPRWLSGWGLAALLLMFLACVLALFSDNPVTGYTFLFLPIAAQEMVLAGWLLVKGFSPSSLVSDPSTAIRPLSVEIPHTHLQ